VIILDTNNKKYKNISLIIKKMKDIVI